MSTATVRESYGGPHRHGLGELYNYAKLYKGTAIEIIYIDVCACMHEYIYDSFFFGTEYIYDSMAASDPAHSNCTREGCVCL